MGPFSISHYASIRVERADIKVRYVLDFAEIPTAAEMKSLCGANSQSFTSAQKQTYLSDQIRKLTFGLHLTLNGREVTLHPTGSDLMVSPGSGGLPTLRVTIKYDAPENAWQKLNEVNFREDNYSQRLGWREVIATVGDGFWLLSSNAAQTDLTKGLTFYPPDAIQMARTATPTSFTFTSSPQAGLKAKAHTPDDSSFPAARPVDGFTALIGQKETSPWIAFTSIVLAFFFGAFHALSPGHGKTVVAAYLVGSHATPRHALLLGVIVTLTHTLGVFALGLIVLLASSYVRAESFYPWLGLLSGLSIAAIGVWQLFRRYLCVSAHGGGTHAHALHGHVHHQANHINDHENHSPGHGRHVHGPHGHSHELPDRITLTSLLGLGISGGMVPCPSALVVMLGAIAFHRIAFGLILILVFSLGLALILTSIGVLVLFARKKIYNRLEFNPNLFNKLSLASSVLVALIGIAIACRAFSGDFSQL